jgi:ribonuclease VapC
MIAVDTSALLAIVLDEENAPLCRNALAEETRVLISAGTMAEALIAAGQRNVGGKLAKLIDGIGAEVISVTAASAVRVAQAYARWGKGVHPAGLNLGDCFAYDAAKEHACPLLFVGDAFSRTDVDSVL